MFTIYMVAKVVDMLEFVIHVAQQQLYLLFKDSSMYMQIVL